MRSLHLEKDGVVTNRLRGSVKTYIAFTLTFDNVDFYKVTGLILNYHYKRSDYNYLTSLVINTEPNKG